MLLNVLALVTAMQALPGATHRYTAAAPPTGPVVPMTEARVLGTLGAVDANQIEVSKLGAKKGNSAEVRDYATMMQHDHEHSLQANTVLSKAMHLSRLLPADSTMARAHKDEMTELNLLSGAAFDTAFVTHIVADHIFTIKDVNTRLLPAATHPQVKNFIQELLPVLQAHQNKGQEWLAKKK